MVQTYSDTEQAKGQQTSDANQAATASYRTVIDAVHHLPLPMLTSLLREIADTIGQRAGEAQGTLPSEDDAQHNSVKLLLGRMRTSSPPPTDAEVAQWLDERRLEKYG